MKKIIYLSIFILTLFCFCACEQKNQITPSGKIIKIGVIAPFSGPHHAKGREGLKGIKAAVGLDPYLQNGDRIHLIQEDDRNDPDLSAALLKKLAEKDEVTAVIAFSGSSSLLRMAAFADEYKTPVIAAIATNPDIVKDNIYISQLCFDDDFQGNVAALFARDELLVDKVAVFKEPGNAYSSYLSSSFEKRFVSIGGEITNIIDLTESDTELSEAVKKVRANNPELLYVPVFAKDVIRIAVEAHKLNWHPGILGSDGLTSTLLSEYNEDISLLEGIMETDFYANNMPLTPYGRRIIDELKDSENSYSILGAEAYTTLMSALNRCTDNKNRECVNNQIRATKDIMGVVGRINIGSNGKGEHPLCINVIRRGRPRFIAIVH